MYRVSEWDPKHNHSINQCSNWNCRKNELLIFFNKLKALIRPIKLKEASYVGYYQFKYMFFRNINFFGWWLWGLYCILTYFTAINENLSGQVWWFFKISLVYLSIRWFLIQTLNNDNESWPWYFVGQWP